MSYIWGVHRYFFSYSVSIMITDDQALNELEKNFKCKQNEIILMCPINSSIKDENIPSQGWKYHACPVWYYAAPLYVVCR